jgi:hypothetical protein
MRKRARKPRVTKRSLSRDLKAALLYNADLTARLDLANKERIELFHKIGVIEANAVQMRGEAQRIADLSRTVLGRQDKPAPPMTNIMLATRV